MFYGVVYVNMGEYKDFLGGGEILLKFLYIVDTFMIYTLIILTTKTDCKKTGFISVIVYILYRVSHET